MRPIGAAIALVVLVAAGAQAAIGLVSQSTVATSARSPPVTLEIGAGGATTRYFAPLALSANATVATGTLLGRAGADLYVHDALRLVNARAVPQGVTLSAGSIASASVEVFHVRVHNSTALLATLDLKAASPTATFTIPASTSLRLDVRLDLADGAGNSTAPASFDLRLRVGTGGLALDHTPTAPALRVHQVTVPFRPLLAGSSVGANSTNATLSVNAPTILQSTQNALWVNNTHGTAASFVRLVHVGSSSTSDVSVGRIGIDNGTTSADHVIFASGSLTQPSGAWQRLAPASANRLYVTSLEGLLFDGATVEIDMYVSDTAAGSSYVLTKARFTLT